MEALACTQNKLSLLYYKNFLKSMFNLSCTWVTHLWHSLGRPPTLHLNVATPPLTDTGLNPDHKTGINLHTVIGF